MAEITSLTSILKGGLDLNDYFVVANKNTKRARKLSAKSMFPALVTSGTGGESLWTSITNGKQIKLKGLKSGDTGLLTVTTTDDNLVLTVLEAGIDLSLCNNTTSAFLTNVDLSTATNTLGVVRGGTGLTTISKGSILYGSATDTISTLQFVSNGQILIGNATTGTPQLGTIQSSDSSITVTNSAGGIDLKAAATSSLASTLDTSTYNINLNNSAGTSFISGDGTNEGVTIDDSGRVFVGDGTPTVPTMDSQLTLGGSTTKALVIGNTNAYKAHTIEFKEASGTTAGLAGTIKGAQAGSGGAAGGSLTIAGGASVGANAGGHLYLDGGDYDSTGSASGGSVYIRTNSAHNSQGDYFVVAPGGATTMRGAVELTSTLTVGGEATFTEAVLPTDGLYRSKPVVLADSTPTTLTIAANCGRTNVIVDLTATTTYNIPTPTAAGQYYHFIYGGNAADAQNVILRTVTTNNSVYFKGAITHLDTNADNVAIFSDGDSNEMLTITTPQTIDVHCLALSTTVWYIWGTACSVTAPAFAD